MISKKTDNLKIATILPYKENYTFKKASAASLWVAEFFKDSKFNKNNTIYGHTKFKDYLTKNYKNIELKSINSKFRSSTNEYSSKLIEEINNKKFDLVEIHNRPLIFFNLINKINTNIIFYFHNDPLSMNGSKKVIERLTILKNVKKIIFVSEWVKSRFFFNLDQKITSKTEVVYPSVNKQAVVKKYKIITFVGRLNHSKGYDIFGDAVVKILDEFPEWKALSLGNEDRRSIYIEHINHKELGFLNHKNTLDVFNKSEIAIIPSRWEEPFGRTSLEASSRGCATIISNRGGLLETTNNAVVLKKLDSINLYKEIKKLILFPKFRKNLQRLSKSNIKHLISENTKKIDQIRENIFPKYNFGILRKRLKIINLYNQGQKINHRLYNISLGKKFTNGFIRNNHDVLEISDRDFVKTNRSFNLISSRKVFQKYLIETFKNYNPNFLLFGHTKNIDLETLDILRSFNKDLIISQWNEDPVMASLDYSKKNISNIKLYSSFVDHNFISTDPSVCQNRLNSDNFHFFFVPVDKNIECFDVFNLNPKNDLFYAMSHGVNRAVLKKGIEDNRIIFLNKFIKKIKDIKYDFYGFDQKQPVWGDDFNNALTNSKMALNLSRGKPSKYYSSNRIASLIGNGLLTFIDKKTHIDSFFNNNEVIFYNDIDELASKVIFYSKNDKLRKKIAKNGKDKYFKLFNGNKISKHIIDVSMGNRSNLFE